MTGKSRVVHQGWQAPAIGLFAALLLTACASTGVPPASRPASARSGQLKGTTVYQPVPYISAMPFIVIEVTSTGDSGFDYYLRDALVGVGFPQGITQAQLAKVYVDAGLAETTPYTGDPIAMRRLSDVVGPFVRLRVDYESSNFGIRYQIELWDVRSATPVLAMSGYRLIWASVSKELGPEIVAALARWREDSLIVERDAADQAPRSQT
jgi:hypothetical protein